VRGAMLGNWIRKGKVPRGKRNESKREISGSQKKKLHFSLHLPYFLSYQASEKKKNSHTLLSSLYLIANIV